MHANLFFPNSAEVNVGQNTFIPRCPDGFAVEHLNRDLMVSHHQNMTLRLLHDLFWYTVTTCMCSYLYLNKPQLFIPVKEKITAAGF